MELAGIEAVVTGAASGLGAATAKLIVQAGGRVAMLDVNATAGAKLAAELGERAVFYPTDVREPEQVADAFAAIAEQFTAVRLVVSAAGVPGFSSVFRADGELYALQRFNDILEVNLIGLFDTVRHGAQLMARNEPDADGERGLLVNVGSIAAFDGQSGSSGYSASKGGVVAMTIPLARELGRFGIRVMSICPGAFDTGMTAPLSAAMKAEAIADVPFPNRFGRPSEFATLVRALVENTMLNGETIRIDGGLRMANR